MPALGTLQLGVFTVQNGDIAHDAAGYLEMVRRYIDKTGDKTLHPPAYFGFTGPEAAAITAAQLLSAKTLLGLA